MQLAVVFRGLVLLLPLSLAAALLYADEMVEHCRNDGSLGSLPTGEFGVLSLNVSHGRNTALNQLFVSKKRTYENLDSIAELLASAEADIVALQEADAASRWSGKFDHVAYLADKADFSCLVHGRHSQSWISSYGTALLSASRPSESISVRFSPSWPSKQKGYVSAIYDWPVRGQNVPVTLVSVHFDFLRESVRNRQVQELVDGLSEVAGPLVLMGDLNSEWIDNTSQVRMLADKLELHAYYPEHGDLGTYKKPGGKRLDWILISRHLEFADYKVMPDVVADHFAVYARLRHRGEPE